ncbi:MAG: hypothetical protein IT372_33235 [Polyangiaceae bacterium]|nr:hypothetical protein [Polyangiaceae bacterium]
MLTVIGVAAATIPLPVVPDRLLARIRGAVAHDTAARHGLSLTGDARDLLARPGGDHNLIRKAAEVVAGQLLRRISALGTVAAVARGLEVYALGHLLDRYITRVRPTGAVRIHGDEARRLRDAIDRASARALSPSLDAGLTVLPDGAEDLRDEFTRWIDALLLTGAGVPSYLERRLNAAFDEIAQRGLTDG